MGKNLSTEFKKLLADFKAYKGSVQLDAALEKLWHGLYASMEGAGCLDSDYVQHTDEYDGIDSVRDRIGKMSFSECCTWLTWILRGDRLCEGLFDSCVQDGAIPDLMKRACTELDKNIA